MRHDEDFGCCSVGRIPRRRDYDGVMGVPITFMDKYNPEQFEIVGLDRYVEDNPKYGHRFTMNGKETYARIFIRHRKRGVRWSFMERRL